MEVVSEGGWGVVVGHLDVKDVCVVACDPVLEGLQLVVGVVEL